MKLRYYLRGIGIGMLVTAAILHFTFENTNSNQSMTDDEVRIRALELGMIENTTLKPTSSDEEDVIVDDDTMTITSPSSLSTNTASASHNSVSDNGDVVSDNDLLVADNDSQYTSLGTPLTEDIITTTGEAQFQDSRTNNHEALEAEDRDGITSDSSDNDDAARPSQTASDLGAIEYKVITISSGDGSYTVARKVAEAGLVDSAATFDAYLCANNYDKILTTGSHRVPVGASDKEIADILTSRAN